ncbi:PLP-dependent aminotransferase family protein [Massilia sp. W12]|uniref:MocR-like pyridoxine biosynthesis transcription factor PdxR n=1 Tax=Massilia sp. W12 TaxID=3126507 RepID=UPI0030CC4B17
MKNSTLSDFLQQKLEREHPLPMNRQLYQLIREAILQQYLPVGLQLPSSRELARELGIARNTVMFAYEQLIAEGFLQTRPGAGSFIADTTPQLPPEHAASGAPLASQDAPLFSRRARTLLAHSGVSEQQSGAFMPGLPDVAHFPYKVWTRLHNKVWRRARLDMLSYSQSGGYMPLRAAIADYLRLARSVNCSAENVLITHGIHQSLDLIAKLLCDAGDTAWVEEPGYWGIKSVLHALDVTPVPMAVDEEGMRLHNPAEGTCAGPKPKLICVTPSHQYPTGALMSLARRRQLLEYAQSHQAWVVEDDYDSEFRFMGRPLASLQGMDAQGRVLYTGTFSKTLFPGLRIGFLVVPPALAPGFATALSELYRGGHIFTQAVLTDFINEGHFAAHVRRMRQLYAERRLCLQQAIARELPKATLYSGGEAGLHLTLRLPDECDDVALCAAARAAGIIARPLSAYHLQTGPACARGLVLGYAHVPPAQIDSAFAQLARLILQYSPTLKI